MREEYVKSMEGLIAKARKSMADNDWKYNTRHDMLEYFPKDWASCYTYILENLNRLDSLHASTAPAHMIREKFTDLLSYVLLSYAHQEQRWRDSKLPKYCDKCFGSGRAD